MAHDPRRSERDAALRTVLVQRANASRSPHRRSRSAIRIGSASRRLQLVATAGVSAAVIALSGTAIVTGQSGMSAADRASASSSSSTGHATQTSSAGPSPYSGSLVALDGATVLTRAQLHAWTLAHLGDSADAAIGEQQDWLDIQCMAERGYLDDPTLDGSGGLELGETYGLTPQQLNGYTVALWGPPSSQPYDWRTAGCHGRSVHLTGQDDDH